MYWAYKKILIFIFFLLFFYSSLFASIVEKGKIPNSRLGWLTVSEDTKINKDLENILFMKFLAMYRFDNVLCVQVFRKVGNKVEQIAIIEFENGIPKVKWLKEEEQ